MFHKNPPSKRGVVDDPQESGPAEKKVGLETEGEGNNDAQVGLDTEGDGNIDASVRTIAPSNNPSTSMASPNATEGQNEGTAGKVLLFTIKNATPHTITVDVLQSVCALKGVKATRIVIFRQNGAQAMVEFDSGDDATTIKNSLNEKDIYPGCCTLKIDWGKSARVNVVKNDQDNWDYTLETGEKDKDTGAKGQPLLPIPSGPSYIVGKNGQLQRPNMPLCGSAPPGTQYQQPPVAPASGNDDGSNSMLQQGSVLMVYGLNNEKMNCQRIFNLFCLYGNVVRVKFLKSKDGVVMVQLGDNASCERAIKNINGSFVFDHKMLMGYSKQAFIQDVPAPINLPDGTISYMDFMGNRNNRFTTPEASAKNRIQPASRVLYFFNAPPAIKETDFHQVFNDCNVKTPKKIKIFPSKTQRSSTGLLEWETKGECVEALIAANHTPIPNPSGTNPYVLKFCFSDAPIKG